MVVKVGPKCEKCKKKIKKVLCKVPKIENQVCDEKNNAVNITVVCCSPEKIKKKICWKGGAIILGIEIPKPTEKPKPLPKPPESNPKPQPPKHQQPPPALPPAEQVQHPRRDCCREC